MASPGNRHCANCIGTLSFPTAARLPSCRRSPRTDFCPFRAARLMRGADANGTSDPPSDCVEIDYCASRIPPACLQCFDAVGWAAGRASGL